MTREVDRRKMVEDFLRDIWSDGNVDRCGRYLSDIYTIHHDPGDPWDGQTLDLAAFEERVRQSRKPFPDQQFRVQEMFADGNAVVATWLWSATHRGDIQGFPATGKPVTMSGVTIYYFDNEERISGHWQVVDRLGVFRQLQRARAS